MIESVEFTFPMWLKMYEEKHSLLEWYRVDPKVIQALVAYLNYEIFDRKAAESFAPNGTNSWQRQNYKHPAKGGPSRDALPLS